MRQLYYTSCIKGTTGSAGFQVKALSPGIAVDQRQALTKILGYRIPPDLPAEDIESHPTAFRYQYIDSETCVLVCSQSCGPDEAGRPGNFFAHCVVTNPQDFAVTAPIMFWGHSFWKRSDPSERIEIPEEEAFRQSVSLDFDDIWPFLEQGSRREWLKGLLCAVLRFDIDRRPVVILDSTENVVQWIAAVTFALPAPFRPLISFATYHHDPYQVPFLITGTTTDGRFRFSTEEYLSYFVLNAQTGKTSEATESAYVAYVLQSMNVEAYEERLMGFFQFCNAHLTATATRMAERFDSVTQLYKILHDRSISIANPGALDAVKSLLASIEAERTLSDTHQDDVVELEKLLRTALAEEGADEIVEQYVRVLALLGRTGNEVEIRCHDALLCACHLAASGRGSSATRICKTIERLVSGERRQQLLGSLKFIGQVAEELARGGSVALQFGWSFIVPLLKLGDASMQVLAPMVILSLECLDKMQSKDVLTPPLEAERLCGAVASVIPRNPARCVLLDTLAKWSKGRESAGPGWFYYQLVQAVSLEKRGELRAIIVKAGNPALTLTQVLWMEISNDVRMASIPELRTLFEAWVAYAKRSGKGTEALIPKAAWLLWPPMNDLDGKMIAEQVLLSPMTVELVDNDLTGKLVGAYFVGVPLAVLQGDALRLGEQFVGHIALDPAIRAILCEALAMTKGEFSDHAGRVLPSRFASLDSSRYQQEAGKLIQRFFDADVTLESHIDMLQVVYAAKHQEAFWDIYWKHFSEMALSRDGCQKTIALLSFWFDESLDVLRDRPYLGPAFFLQLPSVLAELSQQREFEPLARALKSNAAKYPWYQHVNPYLSAGRERGLFGFLSRDRK